MFRNLSLAALLSLAAIWAGRAEDAEPSPDSPYEYIQVLARAMQLIRQDYVDDKKISYRDLTYSALRGMLQELDPHSQFMEPADFQDMQEETRSEFGGLGVVVGMQDGVLTIISPMEDSPGFTAGLLPGDKILRINGESTEKMSVTDAVEKLRGDIGDKVTLTIQQAQSKEIRDVELTRTVIKVKSVKDAQLLPVDQPDDPKIGYVRITQFNEPTADELARALEKLEKQGLQALVLDLRYNPGGLLTSAIEVAGLFLPPGTKVVSTEGRTPGRDYTTPHRGRPERNYPIVVLVNFASASGSEVVAGALKDLQRAVVVGETTFGKGSVQSVIALPDGSAVRLTTAKYYTPKKEVIHEVGVTPHIRANLTPSQEIELLRSRREQDAGGTAELSLNNDPQLSRAVDVLRGMLIFSDRHPQFVRGKNP